MKTVKLVTPPKSWENHNEHFKIAIQDDWYRVLTLVQDEINHSSWNFFRNQGFKSVNLPITTGSVTSPMGLGSDSLPVKINLYGVDTYLSDSMQFHLEYALRILKEGVHYIMPSFRGEDADERHLCQFYHSEAELIGDLEDVIRLVNQYIHSLCLDLYKNLADEIKSVTGSLEHIESFISKNANFERITFEEAAKELKYDPKYIKKHAEGFRYLTNLGEQKLIENHDGIVWVTNYDYISVPFYQASTDNAQKALNGDLLFGIGEVVGCGQRHKSVDQLRNAMAIHKVKEENYSWYLSMKDNYPLTTSGFGMGIERFILWLLQKQDIRDCQLIPRFNGILINP